MADLSTATANSTKKKVHPEGMEKEAGLLAQLAEVPLVSKAWIKPLQEDGALVTVSDPFYAVQSLKHSNKFTNLSTSRPAPNVLSKVTF